MYDVRFLQFSQVHERRVIFNALVADGLAGIVFYDSLHPTFEDFEELGGYGKGWCVPVYQGSNLAAVGYVNCFTGRAAFVHSCVFKAYTKESLTIGRTWCRAVLATGLFDCLLGFTPATYRHALNFIQQIGFELSPLRAPGACFIARKNRYVDGVYSRLLEVK